MSTSLLRLATSYALAIAVLCPLDGQSLTGSRTVDYGPRAMQVLRDLFPGLKNNHVVVDYSFAFEEAETNTPNYFQFYLHKQYESPGPDGRDWRLHMDPLFTSRIQFNVHSSGFPYIKDGQLMTVMNSGPFIDGRLDELRKELDAHHKWSNAQFVAKLKAAGAKFGPNDRDALLRALPLKVLEPYTGRLEPVDIAFDIRNDHTPAHDLDLTWRVETKWHSDDGRFEARYFLYFEPFEGALTSLDFRWPRPVE